MPVVITDKTNKVWTAEDPASGFILVGWTGKGGVKLVELLEFLENHQRQWKTFLKKKHLPPVLNETAK